MPCSALARTHDFKNFLSSIHVFCCKTVTMLWYDASYCCLCMMPHIVACVCNPLCHHLYTIFISSPECAHLSPSTCKPLFVLLHLILRCPSSYCLPHAINKCQMTILISYFPCLAARFSPREDCSIRPLAPLFAYLRIQNSLIRQNFSSLIGSFSSMRFHVDQEGCCPRCNPLS